jgi:hypothetical protein
MKRYVRALTFVDVPDHHDSTRVRIRQRLKQDGFDCTEDRRAGSNTETQYQDRSRRESRIFTHLPKRELQITQYSFHRTFSNYADNSL